MMTENDLQKSYHKLTVLQEEYKNCTRCELHEGRTNVVFGIGAVGNILVVAEAPGETEDASGYPLVGQSGQILDFLLAKSSPRADISKLAKSFPLKKLDRFGWGWKDFNEAKQLLMQEVFYTNTVLCRPPQNRNPSTQEIKACNERLIETIYRVDPIIIIAAGKISLETLMGKKVASIQKLCGRLIDITVPGKAVDITYPVMPIMHPAFLSRNPDIGKKEGLWESTLRHIKVVRTIVEEHNALVG